MKDPREIFFSAGGVRCAGDLYLPDSAGDARSACVVMAHGASGTKRLGLPRYAQAFVARGLAALVFDYRNFGASDGQPRQVIDVAAQRDDYRAAIAYARAIPELDPKRVALWGTSLSGGHVLAVAADDPAIAAVVAQVPMIDARHRGPIRHRLSAEVLVRTPKILAAALRDVLGARRGRPPHLLAVVGRSRETAAFTETAARAAFRAWGAEETGWTNAIAARFVFALPRFDERTAERLTMPVLLCLGDRDVEASAPFAEAIAARARAAVARHYPCGHFEAYLDPVFTQMTADQADFLSQHLAHASEPRVPADAAGS